MVQSRSCFGLFLASWTAQSLFLHATWDKFPPPPFCSIGQISVNIRQNRRPPVKRLTHLCDDIGWIEGIKGAAEPHCIAIYSHQPYSIHGFERVPITASSFQEPEKFRTAGIAYNNISKPVLEGVTSTSRYRSLLVAVRSNKYK